VVKLPGGLVGLPHFQKKLARMALQHVTQQLTPDPAPPHAGRDGQVQYFAFPAGHRPGYHEPDHPALLLGDQALESEIIAWVPPGCFRRGVLDIGNGWKVLFGSGSNYHRSL